MLGSCPLYTKVTVVIVVFVRLKALFILRRFPLNVRAVSAKIKLPKKYLQHCHILRTDKKNLSLLLLPSWPREIKLDLKLSIFQLKRRFMSVQNKMAPVFSILLRDLKLIFLRMLENFIAGVTWASELEWDVSNSIQNVTVLWVVFW